MTRQWTSNESGALGSICWDIGLKGKENGNNLGGPKKRWEGGKSSQHLRGMKQNRPNIAPKLAAAHGLFAYTLEFSFRSSNVEVHT